MCVPCLTLHVCTIHHSYAGSKVHRSIRTDHYGASFQAGDVIGCHIALYDDINLNRMSFYKNGVDQGVAFSGAEIPTGVYLPAISIYMKVRCGCECVMEGTAGNCGLAGQFATHRCAVSHPLLYIAANYSRAEYALLILLLSVDLCA